MTPDALFADFAAGFAARRFSAGLLMAFIDLYLELGIPDSDAQSFEQVIARFPRQTLTAGGKRANTLIVARPDGRALSLRPFYNAAERFFRAVRGSYSDSCAPITRIYRSRSTRCGPVPSGCSGWAISTAGRVRAWRSRPR